MSNKPDVEKRNGMDDLGDPPVPGTSKRMTSRSAIEFINEWLEYFETDANAIH